MSGTGERRSPAVAGTFYPGDRAALEDQVARALDGARAVSHRRPGLDRPAGILVPHAGLRYSGVVAAAAWHLLSGAGDATIVLLGTNHGAGWLDGVGAWDRGEWQTPLGAVTVDADLASAVLALGAPFCEDRAAHREEHSVEVQLPLLATVAAGARIVPLAVSAGTGPMAVGAGERLGALLAERSLTQRVHLAISTDMAHYPDARTCTAITERLVPAIVDLDPVRLADEEEVVVRTGGPGVLCGMCGIQPAVLGLAALRAWGAGTGVVVASATSADAGGPAGRTVGYLSVAFGHPAGPP